MRSKTSYFNPTLFKKNLSRFWPLWGGAAALGALLPLYLLTILIDTGFRSAAGKGLQATMAYYEALTYAVPILSLVYAALCALAVWSYLYNARSVGLLHSLPITRKGLFVTNLLSGLAMMLIPYAAAGGLCVLISLPAGVFEPVGVLVTILGVLGHSLFYFAAATLVIFITGNPFAFAAFYFIFQFIAAGMEWLISELMTQFYLGVNMAYEGLVEFLSPTIFLMRRIRVIPDYEQIAIADGWVETGDLLSVSLSNGWLIAVYAAVGVVLLGCAWALYQRRRSESAGEVVAVGWMKPVFRYGVALCAALTGGTVLYTLFYNHRYELTARPVPFAVCMAVAGVIGYYIASMLLAKSLRVFRGSAKGALATVLASAALCFLIAADPAGVESWVPSAGEVTEASIWINSSNGRYLSAEVQDPADLEQMLDLHRAILAEKDRLEGGWRSGDYQNSALIDLHYWIGEKRVSRDYTLFLYDEPTEAVRLAAALSSSPAVQENSLFGEITRDDIQSARLTGGSTGNIYNAAAREIETLDLTQDQAREVEAAVRRDIQAGNFGKTLFLADYNEAHRAVYAGQFTLNYNVTWRADDSGARNGVRRSTSARTVYFTLSSYCTETIQALEDLGILDAAHRLLTQEELDSMEMQDDGTWRYYEDSYPHPAGSVVYPEDVVVYP